MLIDEVLNMIWPEEEDENNEIIAQMVENQRTMLKNQFEEKAEEKINSRKIQDYNELVKGFMILLSEHNNNMAIIANLLNNNVRDQYFDIVDFNNFTAKVTNLNKELEPYLTLPEVDTNDLIDLSRIFVTKNASNIRISTEIPVIDERIPSDLYEIIPLPFFNGTHSLILNFNSELVLINKFQDPIIVPKHTYESCKHMDDITLCNNMEIMNFDVPNECISSILSHSNLKCESKILRPKNYWIKTSELSVYIYIVDPIRVKVNCGNSLKVYNLHESKEINFEENCDITRVTKDFSMTNDFIDENLSFKSLNLNLSFYDETNKNWSDAIPIIDKNKILLLNIDSQLDQLKKERISHPNIFHSIFKVITSPLYFFIELVKTNIAKAFIFSISLFCAYKLIMKITMKC